eukprot:TRINITY_DN6007_c0_g1_i1.p1 TRINITY_DN6007_c0_g1~~TRINITY_DN6007_c0_g1_i1.p1  ORF type:complete len:1070 (-),score=207.54 TRINITY_DN6007_c0_g1_i1:89-3298(-)
MDALYHIEKGEHSFAAKIRHQEPSYPVIKMYGITAEGNSVMVHIHGVLPYIYVPVPVKHVDQSLSAHDLCTNFREALNAKMEMKQRCTSEKVNNYVLAVEIEEKASIMNYRGDEKASFFKITFAIPGHVPTARTILEDGLAVRGVNCVVSYYTFESNIAFVLRFMIDWDIGGGSWLEVPANKYKVLEEPTSTAQIEVEIFYEDLIAHPVDAPEWSEIAPFMIDWDIGGGSWLEVPANKYKVLEEPTSTAQIEVEIFYEDLIAHPVDAPEWSEIAPLRILSFDIEGASKPGTFVDANQDPVIQIANYVTESGGNTNAPLVKNIFVLNSCTAILGADVRCFKTEKELLAAWRDFVIEVDPDIITGYNIVNFDIPYLLDRARKLKLDKFEFLSRSLIRKCKYKEATFSSNQTGTRESKEVTIEGRVIFDVYQIVQRDHKLSSYTLNNVATHFLQQQKEDVHHSLISKLFEGTAEDRRRLAVYCLKDAFLPLRLLDVLMALVNYVEMARVTGVPFSYLLSRGQGIKVVSQLLRKTKEEGFVVPTTKPAGFEGFEGARVIDPKCGFYDTPISTLDFSSLYPSIMQAHNLCYTTLVPDSVAAKMDPDDYEVTPTGNKFIKASKKKGILPQILESLLTARNNAKKLMASEKDHMKRMVYNGRQLALKVSANSVYGFTGQSNGALPCLEISASVTAYGRDMIMLTKDVVLEEYTMKNGYAHDAEVIYGDTDSVMVKFGVETVAEAIKLGREAAELVSSKFPPPIKLEFEKVYFPWLLMSKKKYAGLFWTKPDKWDKIDAKGIESVRRDNCGLVRNVVENSLNKILVDRNVNGAIDFAKGIISDLLQNKIDLSLLIITKSYRKTADAYTSPQPHIVLADKMRARSPATAPHVGDRIPYVIIKGNKNSRLYERAEDPLYVLEHSLSIDASYYLENQLIKPLVRIFSPVMENPKRSLLQGEHTRQITIPTPKAVKGGILSFTQVRESCMGCKATLKAEEKTLCGYCRSNAPNIYQGLLKSHRTKEMQFSRLWTMCQNCQGSMTQEVLCTAADCPIYYMRTQVKKDLKDSAESLIKFDISW